MRVTGVDGCRAGWIAVTLSPRRRPHVRLHATVADLLGAEAASAVIAIDIPIGLPTHAEPGGRDCDRAARAFLGGRRGASVFAPPVRAVLEAADYREALARQRASSPAGVGLSIQCWNIVPKIREVDQALAVNPTAPLVEVHPEVSFAVLAGAPIEEPKRSPAGRARRLALLEAARIPARPLSEELPPGAAADDLIDACVAAWSARRIARGVAIRLPAEGEPPRDERGLVMAIRA